MAQNYAFVVVALLLFVAATPTAYGLGPILGPILGPLGILNLNTTLCCSSSGNCNATTPPLPGVVVKLNCTNFLGVSVQVGQGVTNVNGTAIISVSNILQLLGITLGSLTGNPPQLPCIAHVALPLNQTVCPVLQGTTGLIYGVVAIVSSILNTMVNATVFLFFNIPIPIPL